MNRFLVTMLFAVLMTACKSDDKTAQLVGSWQGSSWKVAGSESDRNASEVRFSFLEDGSYTAQYGDQTETGDFYLKGTKLYTTAIGSNKVEKMVQLSTISPDTLVMEMSRVGNAEQLTLVRIKQ